MEVQVLVRRILRSGRSALRVLPLLGVRLSGAGITAGLSVFVARAFGSTYSGRFFYTVSTVTVVSVLTRLGAESYLTSSVASKAGGDRRERDEYFVATAASVCLLVFVAGMIMQLGLWFFPGVAGTALAGLPVSSIVLAVLGLNSIWLCVGYTRARGFAGISIFLETGMLSLWLLGLVLTAHGSGDRPGPVAIARVLFLLLPVGLVFLTPVLARGRRSVRQPQAIRTALGGIGGFGAVTVTNGIIILIPLQALGWFGMVTDAGIYNAAQRVAMVVGAFGVVIKSAVVRQHVQNPYMQENRLADVIDSGKVALPWLVISLILTWQRHHVAAIFGPDFGALGSIIFIMLCSQCLNVAGFLIETKAVLANERYILNVNSVVTLGVALAVTPALVHQYRLDGAVWGFAITILVARIHLVWMYLRGGSESPRVPNVLPAVDMQGR